MGEIRAFSELGRRFRDLSIREKLLAIMILMSASVLTAACAAFLLIEIHSFKKSMQADISTLARVIGHNCAASLIFNDPADAAETLRTLKAKEPVVSAWLFTREGGLLAGYRRTEPGPGVAPPAKPEADFHRFEGGRLLLYRTVSLDGREIGGIYLVSGLDTMQAILRRNVLALGAVLLGGFVMTYVLASRLRGFISDPISDLAKVAKEISREKNFEARAEKWGNDEVGSLVEAFNEMIAEIQKREAQLVNAKQEAERSATEARELLGMTEKVNLSLEREIRERRRVEEELKMHRQQLERLVGERTAQLSLANEQLREEVEERRRVEESIRASLEEKVVLLREIHHRVKNNLQIIASLLEMSRQRAGSPEASEQLSEAHAKIFTMALIHSQLYKNERFDQVSMERHVRELVAHLCSLYLKGKEVRSEIRIGDIRLPVTQAIPCALALNELISNAFKYAFEGRESGALVVSMQEDKGRRVTLEVVDDGVGIPPDIDIDRAESLGLKLVRNLVCRQLRGRLLIERNRGTRVRIEFQVPKDGESHVQDPGSG